jgi:hypothetical protein
LALTFSLVMGGFVWGGDTNTNTITVITITSTITITIISIIITTIIITTGILGKYVDGFGPRASCLIGAAWYTTITPL